MPDGDADIVMGFKRITLENLALSDISRHFGFAEPDWIAWFEEVQLTKAVPEPVRRLFELARGTMIYGWFYYPLLSLGADECMRCLEAGARHAAASAGLCPPPDKQSKIPFLSVIERLVKAKFIQSSELVTWDAGRALRNAAAHPTTPTIWAPGQARAKLGVTGERLNALFAAVSTSPSDQG